MYLHYLPVIFLFGITVSDTLSIVKCPNNFIPIHKSCYYFAKTSANWAEATLACRSLNAQLVSIETAEESLEITLHILYEYSTGINFWTSGSDVHAEGRFKWMGSQKNFTYGNWCEQQPDNHSGNEHCVELLKRQNYRVCLNDVACNSRVGTGGYPMYFICEYEINQH